MKGSHSGDCVYLQTILKRFHVIRSDPGSEFASWTRLRLQPLHPKPVLQECSPKERTGVTLEKLSDADVT